MLNKQLKGFFLLTLSLIMVITSCVPPTNTTNKPVIDNKKLAQDLKNLTNDLLKFKKNQNTFSIKSASFQNKGVIKLPLPFNCSNYSCNGTTPVISADSTLSYIDDNGNKRSETFNQIGSISINSNGSVSFGAGYAGGGLYGGGGVDIVGNIDSDNYFSGTKTVNVNVSGYPCTGAGYGSTRSNDSSAIVSPTYFLRSANAEISVSGKDLIATAINITSDKTAFWMAPWDGSCRITTHNDYIYSGYINVTIKNVVPDPDILKGTIEKEKIGTSLPLVDGKPVLSTNVSISPTNTSRPWTLKIKGDDPAFPYDKTYSGAGNQSFTFPDGIDVRKLKGTYKVESFFNDEPGDIASSSINVENSSKIEVKTKDTQIGTESGITNTQISVIPSDTSKPWTMNIKSSDDKCVYTKNYSGSGDSDKPFPEGADIQSLNGTYYIEAFYDDEPDNKSTTSINVINRLDLVLDKSVIDLTNEDTTDDNVTITSYVPTCPKPTLKLTATSEFGDTCSKDLNVNSEEKYDGLCNGFYYPNVKVVLTSGDKIIEKNIQVKYPASFPTPNPTVNPTTDPSVNPSIDPSITPSITISNTPKPSVNPSVNPSNPPSPTPRPTPNPTSTATPRPTPSPNKDKEKCDKEQKKLDEIEQDIIGKINQVKIFENIIKSEYLKSTPDLDRVRESDVRIQQYQSQADNLFEKYRNITNSYQECDFKRIFKMSLEEGETVYENDDNPPTNLTFGTKANTSYLSFYVGEGGYKFVTLKISRPFLLPEEFIQVTGKMVLKSITKGITIAEWDISEYFSSGSPFENKIKRVWYGRKGIDVGPDLADIDSYELVLNPIVSTNVKGGITKLDINSPNILVANKYPQYVKNGIPKVFPDNGYHVLSRHAINFLTEAQKKKYKELFQTYIEASKRIVSNKLPGDNDKSIRNKLQNNFDALLRPFGYDKSDEIEQISFNDIDLITKKPILRLVNNVETKATGCYGWAWSPDDIKNNIYSIANLLKSQDQWDNRGYGGIPIIGKRSGVNIRVFVDDNNNGGKGTIATGYPLSGTSVILGKENIQNVYLNLVLSGFDKSKANDKDYILNNMPLPNYSSLDELRG